MCMLILVKYYCGGGVDFFKILGNSRFRGSFSLYMIGEAFQRVWGSFSRFWQNIHPCNFFNPEVDFNLQIR